MEISKTGKNLIFLTAVFFIFLGIVFRIVPHAPNFTPIGAIALFGAVYLPKRIAFILPIAAMLVSDFFIGFYELPVILSVYGSFVVAVVLGFWLKKHKKWHTIAETAIFSSVLFFLITNFAVWAFTPLYAKTFFGLMQSYYMAMPFFKNTLLADLFYASVFFGAYEMVFFYIKKRFKAKAANVILTEV